MASGIVWQTPPSYLVVALKKWQRDFFVALAAICQYHGQAMQDDARQKAPWSDRTGNARGGLFFAFEGDGIPAVMGRVEGNIPAVSGQQVQIDRAGKNTVVIWLAHTMYYGVFLEVSNGGKYAVIMSTIEGHLPELEASLRNLMK